MFALLTVRTLVPGPIGLADNGDGSRLMCRKGLWQTTGMGKQSYFDYVTFSYAPDAAACATAKPYVTSQSWLLEPARWLTVALGLPGTLNLIALALIQFVLIGALVAALIRWLPDFTVLGRLGVGALLAVVLADAAFAGYFASPYSEPAGFIGMLGCAVAVFGLWSADPRERRWALALFAAAGVYACAAKTQTALLAIPLAVLVLLPRVELWNLRGRWRGRLLPAAAAVLILSAAVQVSSDQPRELAEVNAYDTVFTSIVDGDHNTEADLKALGLPTSWDRYAGHSYWDEPSARNDPRFLKYKDRINFTTIGGYYLTHPGRVGQILQKNATHLLAAQSVQLGSYPKSAGQPPRTVEHRVAVFARPLAAVSGGGLLVLVPLWGLICWSGLRTLRRGERAAGLVQAALVAISVSQFGVAALAEGIEITKHMAFALFALALGIAFMVISARQPLLRQLQPVPSDTGQKMVAGSPRLGSVLRPEISATIGVFRRSNGASR